MAPGSTFLEARREFRLATPDPRVRREARRAAVEAALAVHRARRIGAADAFDDRVVARRLRRATVHATRAATYMITPPPPRHRLRNTMLFVAGAAAMATAIVIVRRQTGTAAERISPV